MVWHLIKLPNEATAWVVKREQREGEGREEEAVGESEDAVGEVRRGTRREQPSKKRGAAQEERNSRGKSVRWREAKKLERQERVEE